jgi:hypothetical protein
MKRLSLPLLLTFFALSFISIQSLQAQIREYQSAAAGDWKSASSWLAREGYATTPPPFDAMNQKTVVIVEHNITLDDHFSGNNDIVFYVRNGATLTINGNFDVGNSVKINVENGSHFIVEGFVDLSPSNATNNLGVLAVNGSITIKQGLVGHGVFEGSGSAYITGNVSGISYTGFTGEILVNGTNINNNTAVASPTNLTANVTNMKVDLTWNNVISTVTNYTFYGYQVYRSLGGPADNFQLLSTIVGDTRSFADNLTYDAGSVPKYTVRAVYRHNTNSNDFLYSAYSNTVDFSISPLPIELLYFRAKAVHGAVAFNWATLTETNNDFFTIEKSYNGRDWSPAAFVTGAGNHNGVLHYQTSVFAEHLGIVYFRLRQTDFDGQFEYFTPVAVNLNAATGNMEIVSALASNGSLRIQLRNPSHQAALIISDMQGRLIGNYIIQPDDFTQSMEIVLPGSSTGRMLFIRMAATGASVEKKVVVN